MSWLSSLFKGRKPKVPDTSAQEAELRRQTELLMAQFRDLMAQQDRLAQEQRAADQGRYDSQRAADLAEAARRESVQQRQFDEQMALQREGMSRAEAARVAQEAQAAARAAQQRTYAEGRKSLVDQISGAVDAAYAPMDENYYQNFAQRVVNAGRGSEDRAFADNRRAARLALADRGNLNSSAGARNLNDLRREYQSRIGSLVNTASDAATRLRDQVEAQKQEALRTLVSSAFVGDTNLPDGVSDPNSVLDEMAARLNTHISNISQSVRRYTPMGVAPSPTPVGTPQSTVTSSSSSVPVMTQPAPNPPNPMLTSPFIRRLTGGTPNQNALAGSLVTSLTGGG